MATDIATPTPTGTTIWLSTALLWASRAAQDVKGGHAYVVLNDGGYAATTQPEGAVAEVRMLASDLRENLKRATSPAIRVAKPAAKSAARAVALASSEPKKPKTINEIAASQWEYRVKTFGVEKALKLTRHTIANEERTQADPRKLEIERAILALTFPDDLGAPSPAVQTAAVELAKHAAVALSTKATKQVGKNIAQAVVAARKAEIVSAPTPKAKGGAKAFAKVVAEDTRKSNGLAPKPAAKLNAVPKPSAKKVSAKKK